VSKSKTINLANLYFFSAALLATGATSALNPIEVRATSDPLTLSPQLRVEGTTPNLSSQSLVPFPSALTTESSSTNLLLAQTEPNVTSQNDGADRSNLLRLTSVAFFLLFFVPLGIFYPLFLFYRMLLVKPEKSNGFVADESQPETIRSRSAKNYSSPAVTDITKATVSKLQIAFSPPAKELRKELSRVSSVGDIKSDRDIVDLMHQTVDVLIEQQHWSHISHSSQTFPLHLVKPKFDSISKSERKKFKSKQPGLVERDLDLSGSEGYERNYSYVVVTLILCTSHAAPLFTAISTKKQLIEELTKLKNIEENAVIKFELLWNPQQENIYISNDRLLVEYDEMIRLF